MIDGFARLMRPRYAQLRAAVKGGSTLTVVWGGGRAPHVQLPELAPLVDDVFAQVAVHGG